MHNLIKYVSDVLNVKTDNPLTVADMELELRQIEDLGAYREFIRDNFSTVEYATGFQRFIILTNKYKALQEQAKVPMHTAKSFSKGIAEKVEEARVFIKNEIEVGNERPFSSLKRDSQPYFTLKELTALSELGSARYLIELAEQNRLEEELVKLTVRKFKSKAKYEALSDGEKKVKALIGAKNG